FYFQNQLPPDEEVLFLASQENENKKSMDSTGWPLYPVDNYQNLKPEVSSIIQDLQLNSRIKYSSQLAESLYNFWKGVKRSHRHVLKQAPFHVISHVSMPANLIEMGYLTNEKEAKKLRTLEYQRQIANSLFKGLVNYKESMDKTPINDLN
ncbi:MAG: N-acetylmuramoyl-L-alanine amidase, partial [Bdellovibrionales bacterium]|nr:N-acetylmuramoyl-L-alanine amidase [Bdellovibrionales bacterium]